MWASTASSASGLNVPLPELGVYLFLLALWLRGLGKVLFGSTVCRFVHGTEHGSPGVSVALWCHRSVGFVHGTHHGSP